MIFRDRIDAGERLAEALFFLKGRAATIVLGIPRGGIVVAAEVARALGLPLDVWMAHKIGAPGNPEFAISALSQNDDTQLEDALQRRLPADYFDREVARQREEIARRARLYRGERAPPEIENKVVVLVDDGLATGCTALAALKSLRGQKPAQIVFAAPVSPADTKTRLATHADQIVLLDEPAIFEAVGVFYENFGQVTDEEVVVLLNKTK